MFCPSPEIIQKIFMKNSISNLLANSSTNSGSLLDNRSSMRDNNYRSGVGIMIINSDKKIFVGKRVDNKSDAWQMPQGGIDAGENEELAMFRELQEETGIEHEKVKILAKSSGYFYYNLPQNLRKKFWGGKYIGQKQKWFLLRFLGDDSEIDLNSQYPEFSAWKWISKEDLTTAIVRFKKELYQQLVREFSNFL